MSYLFILVVGLVAGTISGIVGTGSSIMLLRSLGLNVSKSVAFDASSR